MEAMMYQGDDMRGSSQLSKEVCTYTKAGDRRGRDGDEQHSAPQQRASLFAHFGAAQS
jgi:hypothetical protein